MSTEIGKAVISGVAMAAAFAIWICSCVITKDRKDRARRWIKYLRSALLLTWIAAMFRTIAQSIFLTTSQVASRAAYQFALILLALSMPLLSIAQALIFVMFIEFTVALHYIKNGAYTDKARKMKIAAYIAVGINVLLVLVTACMALVLVSSGNSSVDHETLSLHILRLEKAFSVIFLIFAVAATAVAIAVKVMWRHVAEIRQAVKFFLASTITYILPHVFFLITITRTGTSASSGTGNDIWANIIGPLLMWFGTLVVLIIMFAFAAKKDPGMWTAALPVKQSQDAHYQPAGQDWYGQNQDLGYGQQQQYGHPQPYGQAELHGQHQPYGQAELYDHHNGKYQLPGSHQQQQQHELMSNEHGRGGQWGPPAELAQPAYGEK